MDQHRLVEDHIPLARKIASQRKKMLPRHIDIEDLRSAAYLGLVEAANRFNPNKGIMFSTFAYPRISGAITDLLRRNNQATSLDSSIEGEGSLAETIAAPEPCESQDEVLEVVAEGLGDQAREMLRLYFYEDVSMKDVGRHFGITESRVSQIFTGCKRAIRERWDYQDLCEELAA